MASEVVLTQGTTVKISEAEVNELEPSPTPAMATLDCIGREVQVQGGTKTENDVTTLCSTAKEFRLGLKDAGSMTINGHWVQGHAAHTVIRAGESDSLTRLVEITFPNGSIWRSLALVSQRSFNFAVDGIVSAAFVFRLTGATQEVDPV
jgi:hypothetical protein